MPKIIIGMLLTCLLFLDYTPIAGKDERLVESWKVGTSTGLFDHFSEEEFNSFKKDGIEYIELGSSIFKDKTDEEKREWIKDFKRKADESGIKIWSAHLPYSKPLDISALDTKERNYTIQEHKTLMRLLKPLNIKKFVIHPSADRIDDKERAVRMQNCIVSLKILTDEVKNYNAQLALEVLPRTCLGNTSNEIMQIVRAVGNGLEVCFDSNHLLKEKPEEFVSKVGKLITTVHFSDYDGHDEKHWIPGRGMINWTNVIAELVKIEYKGPAMHEVVRRAEDNPPVTTKSIVNSWEKLKSDYLKAQKTMNK